MTLRKVEQERIITNERDSTVVTLTAMYLHVPIMRIIHQIML